tara:strand:- start:598 stop:1425 length:828 start_codon:yes stop_codon:yes gene_type:complete
MLTVPAPAKLNLFLHITGRRADGYHELQTCFQLLDYGDELAFATDESGKVRLSSNLDHIASNDNLIIRAARLLQSHTGTARGVDIRLHKKLPIGAGLGGGSSDAATTLLALNHLWGCKLQQAELAALGLKLGADIPVFIHGQSAWAEGIGEKLRPMTLPAQWYLVVTPSCEVSTKEIFSHRQLTRDTVPITIPAFPFSGTRNDCEAVAVALYPEIGATLDWLKQYAPARMTGTGSSVFASFDNKESAELALSELPDNLNGFVAQGINTSPVLQAL